MTHPATAKLNAAQLNPAPAGAMCHQGPTRVAHPATVEARAGVYVRAYCDTHRPDAERELNLAERNVLEDLLDRGISPGAVLKRRHRTYVDELSRRGLVEVTAAGVELVDDGLPALVALGRACGDHDRPLPCLECK